MTTRPLITPAYTLPTCSTISEGIIRVQGVRVQGVRERK
jgi:hypothetical protein